MTAEAIFLAVLLGAALVLFYTGWLRIDLTALLVLLALVLPWRLDEEGRPVGILEPEAAFSGFGSPAVIMVASMFVLSAAMVRTGAAPLIGERLLRAGARSLGGLQATVLVAVTLFSSVINDTTTVLIWMPLVLEVCRQHGHAPSKVLMPLAFASLLGGQWTLIGTRSNILVSDFLRSATGEGLGFFTFTPVAAAVFVVVLVFFMLVGRRLLPTIEEGVSLARRYEVTEYLTEIMATPGSTMVGRSLAELPLPAEREVTILQVIRGDEYLPPSPWLRIAEGDVFVIQGRISEITALLEQTNLQFKEELKLGERTLRSVDLMLAEAVVPPLSDLVGRRLEELDLPSRYGLSILAIGRRGEVLHGRLHAQELETGDSLLLVAHATQMDRLREDPDLVVLESYRRPPIGRQRALIVLGLLVSIALFSATGLLSPAVVIPAAAVTAILTRCISLRGAYEAIDLRTLVILGGMIPYGIALEETGTAAALARWVGTALEGAGPHVLLAVLLLAVVVFTQLIENAAVAIIFAPVAYELAVTAGADPLPFLLGTAICTSSSFMTPVAHESTILVMAPGRYAFRDYLRVGTPLAFITWAVTVLVLPRIYPLTP